MAMKQILFLSGAFGMAAALKPNYLVEEPMSPSLFVEAESELDSHAAQLASVKAELAKSKVVPSNKFSCHGVDLSQAFRDVYGRSGEWMITHGVQYICDSTPHEAPDFAHVLYSLNGTSLGANLEFMKQDCQTILYGVGPVGTCNTVGNHCPECANPPASGLLGTVSIRRNKIYTPGIHHHTSTDCNYVAECHDTKDKKSKYSTKR
eukprot:TRINITY_DN751_c0_g2_i1.p1 TRINITY_DN751_c0_g2~~TRINITY_DN751_c0_g2_i1.p1  ORF type:complete len:226 (+),score=39.68 TRINITY_DN751_c0_g2_i1:61-678(+)